MAERSTRSSVREYEIEDGRVVGGDDDDDEGWDGCRTEHTT